MADLKKTIFREYDLRGKVSEDELNQESCELIGKGFGSFLVKKNIRKAIVGFDARDYSERLKESFVLGLTSTGVDAIEIGQVLTPIAYFSQYHFNIKGVGMITASHNPNGWSGFKLGHDLGTTLLPEDIKELYNIILKEDFEKGEGKIEKKQDVIKEYGNYLLERVNLKKKLKVVVNAGNGTAGPIVPPILRRASCNVIEQFCDIDFTFPNHEPNPAGLKALEALASEVKQEKADIGIGFDGDGDRLGVVDEKGNIIWPDYFMIILARQVLKEEPESPIVFDVKCSQALSEEIEKAGGKPIMWKTGHSYIKRKAKEVKAALAGERSGHIFYRHGYYGFDDATFAALKLLEYLSAQDKTLSEVMEEVPKYFTSPTWQVDCADEIKYDIVERITKEFKEEYGQERIIDINGARVNFKEGWGLVRASSNLPVLVLVFESKTKDGLRKIETVFKEKLSKYPEIGKEWKGG